MIKLFVSDLDGTLLDDDKKVPDENRDALLQLASEGVEICLASGRTHGELSQVMDNLGCVCHRVSQNGSFVYTSNEQLLHQTAFDPELAKRLYAAASKYGFAEMISVGQTLYTPRKTAAVKYVESRMFKPFVERPDLVESFDHQFAPCKLSFFGEMDRLREMQAAMKDAFAGQVDAVIADVDCVDLMPIHVSKGAGLKVLIQRLGISPDELAAVGDSFNDLPMFALTPHSFAMHHSQPEVRQSARHTIHSVAEAARWVLDHNAKAPFYLPT